MGLDDEVLELDVGPNRPDLLGHKGLARELAHAYATPFRLPRLPGDAPDLPAISRTGVSGVTAGVRVAIEDPDGCGRFLAAVVKGIQVGRSPRWLRRPLEALGLRSINNVVDATNYVMLELGQPLHAYDLTTLRGPAVIARAARDGEKVVTLDGQERTLRPGMTVIADAERVIGIAGVYGGRDTEVSGATTDLFLECAWFTPARIRSTRSVLGLSTDASYRFERGVDKWNGPEALRRCLEIILRAAGGTVGAEPVDCWPAPAHPPRIFLRPARVAQIIGVELPLHLIEKTLVAVGATVVSKPEDGRIAVEVPGWRPDLQAEIDLVEEVARVYGYDEIPSDLRPFRTGNQVDAPSDIAADRVRRGLVQQGFLEALTLSLGPADPRGAIRLVNPLSADHAYLRRSLLPGLLREVERNWSAHTRDVRLFEIGTVFEPSPEGRPLETQRVGLVVSGSREPGHWTTSDKSPEVDLWDLEGLLQAAIALANPAAGLQVDAGSWTVQRADGRAVGWAGALTADAPPWAAPVFGLELDIDPAPPPPTRFQDFPTTPASERDLALLVPHAVSAAQVLETARREGGSVLEQVRPIDEYRGKGVPEGTRSIAIRLTFRAPDRTLRDEEVDATVRRIRTGLEQSLGVILRTT
jgi:phenylalanyl-tRNA synthetase beta chain